MWLLCLVKAVLFRCATQHSGLKATVLRHTKRTPAPFVKAALHEGLCCIKCKYWSHLCQGTTLHSRLHHGQRMEENTARLFLTPCANRGKKIYCPLQHPLKGWIGSTTGAVNHLWGLLLPNLETLCNLYSLVSLLFRRPQNSPPARPSACSTCGPRREVLQRRSLHHSVRVSHHKHFVEHSIVVDEALDHTGRFNVLQVLFAEDDGHLGDRRSRRGRLINHCNCSHKPATKWLFGNENYLVSLTEGLIDLSWHAQIHKARHFICLGCLNLS